MKFWRYLPLGICLLMAAVGFARERVRASSSDRDNHDIDEYITGQMRSARIPGAAVVIVKGDQILYAKGYGEADPSGRPVTPQTPFVIGSITKSFTALAVMQLVEAGKVELDAPVQRYIPWFRVADPAASAQITVRMLIKQTSGLQQAPTLVTLTWPNTAGAMERHVRLLAHTNLAFPPGKGFAYSNGNYTTLGLLVETVSGQSYEEYVRQHIFAPLDMHHSFASEKEAVQDGMAAGYRWVFGFPVPAPSSFNEANLPAGFIISSAEDMGHFMISQMNSGRYQDHAVLSPQGIAAMQVEPPPGVYGLGWESTRINGRRLINMDGAITGSQTSLFIDPQAGVGVFVAANAMNALDGLSSSLSTASLGARSVQELIQGIIHPEDNKTLQLSALITARGMSLSVLSMATQQPLPPQGPGQRRVSLIFDLVLLVLTGLLCLSVARIPRWYRRLEQQGINSRSDLARLNARTAISHFTGPLALLYAVLAVPSWILLVLLQIDLVGWLYAVASILSLKGILKIALATRIFKRSQ